MKNKTKIIELVELTQEKAYEKIINGASLVQLYTGMVYMTSIVSNICNELTDIFNSEGIKK